MQGFKSEPIRFLPHPNSHSLEGLAVRLIEGSCYCRDRPDQQRDWYDPLKPEAWDGLQPLPPNTRAPEGMQPASPELSLVLRHQSHPD